MRELFAGSCSLSRFLCVWSPVRPSVMNAEVCDSYYMKETGAQVKTTLPVFVTYKSRPGPPPNRVD